MKQHNANNHTPIMQNKITHNLTRQFKNNKYTQNDTK